MAIKLLIRFQMWTKQKFDICAVLLGLALLFLLLGVVGYRPKSVVYDGFRAQDMIAPIPEVQKIKEVPIEVVIPEAVEVHRDILRRVGAVPLTCTRIIPVNEYKVFLTAYCSEECGFNGYNYPVGHITATGTICHRSTEFMRYEPSTCGVDPRYFAYGTLFYIPSEDRVYVAEDTGYISGAWIDTYQTSMEEMYAYDVRYEYIWTVELEYYEVLASNYDVLRYIHDNPWDAI